MSMDCQEFPRPSWSGPILRVVIAAPDLTHAVASYRDGLGYAVRQQEPIPVETARRWGVPAVAGAASVLLGPVSGIGGEVLLVEAPPTPGYAPLRTYGWAAIEVCVADLDAAVARLPRAFTLLGRPAALSGPAAALRAAQVEGPAGEVIYLTEIRRELPPFRLPEPSPGPDADGVFVAVLAARELERSRTWWEERFPVQRCTDRLATIDVLNQAFDRPAGARTRISSLQLSGRAVLEIDEYPATAGPRPVIPGRLPPGIALVVIGVPETPPGAGNARRVVTQGPDGERVELVPAHRPIDVL